MSESELEAEIKDYESQINQIDLILNSNSQVDTAEYLNLKNDLTELLNLTKESLLEIKKQKLLNDLNIFENTEEHKVSAEDLVASKCRVAYECQNTNIKMHNALVMGVDASQKKTVRVLFCNPTQTCMKICDHFLNNTCTFAERCKFSHGFAVQLEDLHEFKECDYKQVREGRSCLAKYSDELWHLATVENVDGESLCVRFKKFNQVIATDLASILLLDNPQLESSDSDLSLSSCSSSEDEVASLNFSVTTGLGEWEKYTKGIGTKLMLKMGYQAGKGLGKDGFGRVEPVEALVLPEGRISLDRVMELKEKKLLKKRRGEKSVEIGSTDEVKEEGINVFEFINTKLAKNATTSETVILNAPKNPSTSKDLNIQMLDTHNKIREVEKMIAKYRDSLIRNKNSDRATVDQIKQKLEENEKQLDSLRKVESKILNEKNSQKRKSDLF